MKRLMQWLTTLVSTGLVAVATSAMETKADQMSLGEALDAPEHAFITDATRPWIVQTNVAFKGDAALVAGGAWFQTWPLTMSVTGPVTLRFWWRFSTQGCGPVLSCTTSRTADFPYGFTAANLCNETNWTQATVYVPADVTNMTWEFKINYFDSSVDPTNLLGWLDDVDVADGGTAPIIVRSPASQRTFPDRPVKLLTAANGTPPFHFQWRMDGTHMVGAAESELVLTNLSAGRTHVFDCVVSNPYGVTVTESAVVRVLGGPLDPVVRFSCIPPIGSFLNVDGIVRNVPFSEFVVAPYIQAWIGWWNKPYWASPTVPIDEQGRFTFDYTTGGIDETAASMAVFLIPKDYAPPLVGQDHLPEEIFEHAVAYSLIDRVPGAPTLRISRSSLNELAFGMEHVQPDNWFALESSADLSQNSWRIVTNSAKCYTNSMEHTVRIANSDTTFYRAICVLRPEVQIPLEAEHGDGAGMLKLRSNASGDRTVWIQQEGGSRTMTFSAPEGRYIIIVRYSNDNFGPLETLKVYVDELFVGEFVSEDTGDFGFGWNVFREAAVPAVALNAGTHSLRVEKIGGDRYGIEVDKVELRCE